MASWILVPCLVSLRDEFNQLAPGRDKASDGAIGDTSHAAASSDHNPDETGNTPTKDVDTVNEVHAIDVDVDLRKPGITMTRCVEIIVTRHREGRDDRLQNVIYNRRIWSRSWGWAARAYNGPSPHTEHAHFSARYTTDQERDTSPWGLIEDGDDAMLVKKGDSGEQVKMWQHTLTDLGYAPGDVDGDYGPKMEAAVNAFRAKYSAKPYPAITGWTAYALLRDLAARHAGRPGKDGRDGVDGKDGTPGQLSGTLTVVGGQLTVEARQ